MTTTELPVIDLEGLVAAPDQSSHIARQLDEAFRHTGFCYITNTGVPESLVERTFAASRAFHALPQSDKDALAINSAHRGYMAPSTSVIRTSSVARVTRPNLSESLMVMHEVDEHEARYGLPLQGPNQWPSALPEVRETVSEYMAAMSAMSTRLTQLLTVALGLPPAFFAPHFVQPTVWLRLLHYPPQAVDAPADQYGAAPHTDYGFLTILAQETISGLEVRTRDGKWIQATPRPGTFVVNVADMLMRWTNGRWLSTPHRVRNLSGGDRYSLPFFWDTGMDSEICPIPELDGSGAARFKPVVFGDYVMERLNKNYQYRRQDSPAA